MNCRCAVDTAIEFISDNYNDSDKELRTQVMLIHCLLGLNPLQLSEIEKWSHDKLVERFNAWQFDREPVGLK